jgi:hypothetical protein
MTANSMERLCCPFLTAVSRVRQSGRLDTDADRAHRGQTAHCDRIPSRVSMSNASFCSFLPFVLFGYLPLTMLAQSQDVSGVRTSLRETDPVDVGTVISRGPEAVTVKNDLFTRVFRMNAQTEIRRVDDSQLQIGDQVAVRCHIDDKGTSIADSIEANVEKWEGVITRVLEGAVYMKFNAPVKGSGKVTFDRTTQFDWCGSDDPKRGCTLDDLKVGRHLEAVGFVLGKSELRATSVLSIQTH